MEPSSKKNRQLLLAITAVVFLSLAAVSISLFQRSRRGPLAPTAPGSQPQAAEITNGTCSVAFQVLAPSPTPSLTPVVQTCVSVDKSVEDNSCMQQGVALSLLVNNACGTAVRTPLDVVLVFDNSLSMGDLGGNPEEPISSAKNAAAAFVNQLNPNLDQVSLVSFSTEATLRAQLTNNFSTVVNAINNLEPDDATNVGDGIFVGQAELRSSRANPNAQKIIVLLGDGVPNQNHAGTSGCAIWPTQPTDCTRDAINQANTAKSADPSTTIYAIGYRLDSYTQNYTPQVAALAKDTLQNVASSPNTFFESPSINDIDNVFDQIATIISSPIVATDAIITEVLPVGVSYVAGTGNPEPTSVSSDGRTLTWNLGTLNTLQIPISFDVLFSQSGNQLVELYPDSNLTFTEPISSQTITLPFPERFANPIAGACVTPTVTPTETPVPTATGTLVPTSTPTNTPLPTNTPTATVTLAPEITPTATNTPTNTPVASATPVGPTCNNIVMHTFGANQIPQPGEDVYFTCSPIVGAFRYEFRISGQYSFGTEGFVINDLINTDSTIPNNSVTYRIPGAGTYTAECRMCTGVGNDTCQQWETDSN